MLERGGNKVASTSCCTVLTSFRTYSVRISLRGIRTLIQDLPQTIERELPGS
jgi:hypothetical protein